MRRPAYRLVRRPPGPATPLYPDALQRYVIEHTDGPLLVTGGPGTGKTTVLVEAVAARIAEGADPAILDTELEQLRDDEATSRTLTLAHEWSSEAVAALAGVPRGPVRDALKRFADAVADRSS